LLFTIALVILYHSIFSSNMSKNVSHLRMVENFGVEPMIFPITIGTI